MVSRMQTAIEHYGEITADDVLLLTQLRLWLNGLPDKGHASDSGAHLWSCHAICRAAERVFNLNRDGWRVVDGYFATLASDHCWLVREAGSEATRDLSRTVLDILPVAGAGGPIMVSAGAWTSPWSLLYCIDVDRPKRYEDRLAEFRTDASALVEVTLSRRGTAR